MPYSIRKQGNKWLIVKSSTGEKVSEHETEKKAQGAENLLRGIEHGWQPTHKK